MSEVSFNLTSEQAVSISSGDSSACIQVPVPVSVAESAVQETLSDILSGEAAPAACDNSALLEMDRVGVTAAPAPQQLPQTVRTNSPAQVFGVNTLSDVFRSRSQSLLGGDSSESVLPNLAEQSGHALLHDHAAQEHAAPVQGPQPQGQAQQGVYGSLHDPNLDMATVSGQGTDAHSQARDANACVIRSADFSVPNVSSLGVMTVTD